jgi:hypothetical protein
MTTYLIKRERTITRQEGDVADVVFTVPNIFNLVGKTIKFKVYTYAKEEILELSSGNGITVDTQTITCLLSPSLLVGYAGKHRWELEASDITGPITIGKGDFIVTGENIT